MPNNTKGRASGATATTRTSRRASSSITVKQGRKWTYVYAADGSLIAEIRNDSLRAVSNATAAGLAVAS